MFGKWKYLILAVFALAAVACGIMIPFVRINYDNSKYLPADNEVKAGLELLEEEFGSSGYLLVMVEDVPTMAEIAAIKELLVVEGVNHVDYQRNGDDVLFQVVLAESDYSEATQDAVGEISDRLTEAGYRYYMSGQSYLTYYFNDMIKKQLPRILIIVIPIVFLILTIMTTSFIEPLLFAIVTGVAIVLGMGTNLFFPRVSYLTYSVSPVLQLALCMDYSIIMLSRYRHYRKQELSRDEAITKAWKTSLVPVLASSLTTVAGFVAVMFMKYRIGMDVGLVLTKAIIFSLITVIFMLPALIVIFDKLIDKTTHRSVLALFKKEGAGIKSGYNKYIFRTRLAIPVIVLILIGVAFFLQLKTNFIYSDTASTYDLEEIKESREKIRSGFGLTNQVVILLDRDRDITSLLAGLENLRYEGENYITSVFAYTKQYSKEELKSYLKDYDVTDEALDLLYYYVNGTDGTKTTMSFAEVAELVSVIKGFETEMTAAEMAAALSNFIPISAEDLEFAYEMMGVGKTSVFALIDMFNNSYTLAESVELLHDFAEADELAMVYQALGAMELQLSDITGYLVASFTAARPKAEMLFALQGKATADDLDLIYAFAGKEELSLKELIAILTAKYSEAVMKMLLPEVAGEKITGAYVALGMAGQLDEEGKISLGMFANFLLENFADALTPEETALLSGKAAQFMGLTALSEKMALLEQVHPIFVTAASFDLELVSGIAAVDRETLLAQFVSDEYQRIILTVDLEEESETSFDYFAEMQSLLNREVGEYYLVSSTATIMAIKDSSNRDYIITTAISVGLIFLIIALSFKSFIVPLLLIIVIEGAIFINMAIANVAGTQIIFLGYLIVNCIQLGATIDYGILYTDRYLDRRKHEDRRASVEGAISDSLPTILTTGLILFGAGMVLSAVSGIPVVALLGRLIGIGGLISVLMIIFVLPQVLLLADRLLHKKGAQ